MKPNQVSRKITKFEMYLIDKIVQRAAGVAEKYGEQLDILSMHMDICCAHATNPLKLDELLAAKDADFVHDVFGIRRHINRITCELRDCFFLRYAMTGAEVHNTLSLYRRKGWREIQQKQ